MSDDKIVNIDAFRRKTKKLVDPKERVIAISGEIMINMVQSLNDGGYDVTDPELLYDLEIVTRTVVATICRQSNIKNPNINILDRLRQEDGEES